MSVVKEAADRLDAFLKDESVQEAIELLKKSYYASFIAAQSDDDRRLAQAKAVVIGDFEAMLRAVVDAGTRETLEQEQRDRALSTRTP